MTGKFKSAFPDGAPKDEKPAEIHCEVVLQYNDTYNDQVMCYTNTVHNPDGGTHLSGFRSALTRAINQFAKGKTPIIHNQVSRLEHSKTLRKGQVVEPEDASHVPRLFGKMGDQRIHTHFVTQSI